MQVEINVGAAVLHGNLELAERTDGIIIFAHGSGSGRHSPRNQFVAHHLHEDGLGTLLFDLLTREEEAVDEITRHLRFDIGLLADRLVTVTKWVFRNPTTRNFKVGYFGASTGAAAALVAAAELSSQITAVVSRGGRPDLAGEALMHVTAPTLLIVGSRDEPVIDLNKQAQNQLIRAQTNLAIVPGATHLFSEPGTLEQVASLARSWFIKYLTGSEQAS